MERRAQFHRARHVQEMKKGDEFFLLWVPGDEKRVVGIGEIAREAYPDPTAKKGEPWVAVEDPRRSSRCRPGDAGGDQGGAEAQGHGAE